MASVALSAERERHSERVSHALKGRGLNTDITDYLLFKSVIGKCRLQRFYDTEVKIQSTRTQTRKKGKT